MTIVIHYLKPYFNSSNAHFDISFPALKRPEDQGFIGERIYSLKLEKIQARVAKFKSIYLTLYVP